MFVNDNAPIFDGIVEVTQRLVKLQEFMFSHSK